MKKRSFLLFLSILLSVFCLGGSLGSLPANAEDIDPLPSWNPGANRDAILAFVQKVTTEGPDFVAPEDRIATFDNDGTLWAEKPNYFQADFIDQEGDSQSQARKFNRLLKRAKKEVDLNVDRNIDEIIASLNDIAAFEGITTDDYISQAYNFLNETTHPDFDATYVKLTYKPVIELVNYLKANDFQVYICSGGGVDFIRSFAEDAYGIPTEKVIGSAAKTKFVDDGSGGSLIRQAMLAQYNDQQGKPVGIELHIGKRPIIAVGNSGGDLEMFQYTNVGVDESLIVLINHDDCDREYQYNDTEDLDNESLVEANKPEHSNWMVVSMKNDFKTIFESNPSRTSSACPAAQ